MLVNEWLVKGLRNAKRPQIESIRCCSLERERKSIKDNEGKTCRAGMGSDKEGRNKSGATLPPGNKDKTRAALSPDGGSIMIHEIHLIIDTG